MVANKDVILLDSDALHLIVGDEAGDMEVFDGRPERTVVAPNLVDKNPSRTSPTGLLTQLRELILSNLLRC